jgi:hypothetical protein
MDNTEFEPIEFTRTSELAGNIHSKFQISRGLRAQQEALWIEALQNYNGEYAPNISFREGASSVFVNITQMKTMAAYSRVMAIMMPPEGFPWNIKPTPHPSLLKAGINEKEAMACPTIDPEFKKIVSQAKISADGMKHRIKDDLVQCQWEEKFARGVLDLVTLGTMCFKGPVGLESKAKKWVLKDQQVSTMDRIKSRLGLAKIEEQKYELAENPEDEYRATMQWVSPFELYQDPGGYVVEDCMWLIHRHVMNKAQVVDLATGAGFDPEEIQNALQRHPDGNWFSEPWEGSVNIINRNTSNNYLSKRYVVFEYWGYLSGQELRQAGVDVADEDIHKIHLANVWVIGNNCIKVAISGDQSKRIPFYVVPYEKVPYKLWGRGVPEKMADPQAIINGSARAMVENMGMISGPQMIVDVNRLVPGTKYDQIQPWGIWPVKNMEGSSQVPVQFVKIESMLTELKVIQDIFRNFVQEVTSMPDMTSGIAGQGQHNRTMGGMSMLFGAADSYTRGVIFNIDNYLTKQMIRAYYDWEMQYHPDKTIKGDMVIEASGVSGVLAKEVASQRLAELMQALGQIPGGTDYINMPELLKEVFRGLDMSNDSVILSDPEVDNMRQQRQQAEVEKQGQMAQAQNLPKPKAETTPTDVLLQVLTATDPTSAVYPNMYAKLLDAIGQLDPQSEAALNIMKTKVTLENQAFADEQQLKAMTADIELASKMASLNQGGGMLPPDVHAPAPAAPQPKNIAINRDSTGQLPGMTVGQE